MHSSAAARKPETSVSELNIIERIALALNSPLPENTDFSFLPSYKDREVEVVATLAPEELKLLNLMGELVREVTALNGDIKEKRTSGNVMLRDYRKLSYTAQMNMTLVENLSSILMATIALRLDHELAAGSELSAEGMLVRLLR